MLRNTICTFKFVHFDNKYLINTMEVMCLIKFYHTAWSKERENKDK